MRIKKKHKRRRNRELNGKYNAKHIRIQYKKHSTNMLKKKVI